MPKRVLSERPAVVVAPVLITKRNCFQLTGFDVDPFHALLRKAPPGVVVRFGKLIGIKPDDFYELAKRETAANANAAPPDPHLDDHQDAAANDDTPDGEPESVEAGLAMLGVKATQQGAA